MSKRRPHGMRGVLCIMLLNMVFYYSTYQEILILYQFCALKYDVTYTDYSVMNTFGNFVNFWGAIQYSPKNIPKIVPKNVPNSVTVQTHIFELFSCNF